MDYQRYEVVLDVPLGKRRGSMDIQIDEGKIEGSLFLFLNRMPIAGQIDQKGNCIIAGSFHTMRNSFPYKAEGWIRDGTLDLMLCGERRNYHMSGHQLAS